MILAGMAAILSPAQAAQPQSPKPSAATYCQMSPEAFWKLPAVQKKLSFDRLDLALIDAAVFHETNARRIKAGKKPLKYSSLAQKAAAMQTQAMTFYDFISHENPHDPAKRTLADRLNRLQVHPQFAGENLATAFALEYESGASVYERAEGGRTVYSLKPGGPALPMRTSKQFAAALLDSWMNSPGHRKNVLSEQPDSLGVSCLPEKKTDSIRKFYCTQIFLKL
jgi:uncharacterized protein YkwD